MKALACLVAAIGLVSFGAPARADDNDLVLARLAHIGTTGLVVPDNEAFRSFASELGVVFAPRNLAPADTIGYSGFQFSTELSFTSISSDKSFWCATQQSANCNQGFDRSSVIPTLGIFARKGFWFPLPSFEIGAGAVHILSSRLWSAQAYAKFAVQEGYQGLPIPSIAVRGAVSRLLGEEQLDLTDASLDISISKRFSVAGTFSIAPYLGYAFLWIIPRSQVIDKTPGVSPVTTPGDLSNNFTFPDQDSIVRHRIFAGFKVKYYVFAFTAEVDLAFAGSSVDDREGTTMPCSTASADQKNNCDATDQSGAQAAYSFSVSLDF